MSQKLNQRWWQCMVVLLSTMVIMSVMLLNVEAKTNIVYLGRGGTAEQNSYTKLVEQFEAANTDIDVEVVWIPGGTAMTLMEKLQVLVASGSAPDVFWVHNYLMYDLVSQGYVGSLDQAIATDKTFKQNEYFPAALNDYLFNGKLYGLPRETSSTVLYYNINSFDNAGLSAPTENWTWDTLLNNAKKLTDVSAKRWGLSAPTAHGSAFIMAWQNGGRLFDENRTRPMFDEPQTVQAYQWIADLMFSHGVAPKPGEQGGSNFEAFSAGRLGMMYDIRGASAYLLKAVVDWDVAPLPQGKEKVNRTASSGHAMFAKTKYPEAAWKLVKYLTGSEAQNEFAASGLSVPSMRSVALSPLFMSPDVKPKTDKVFIDALQYGRSDPVTRNYFTVVTEKDKALNALWTGQKPASVVMQDVNRAIDAVFAQLTK